MRLSISLVLISAILLGSCAVPTPLATTESTPIPIQPTSTPTHLPSPTQPEPTATLTLAPSPTSLPPTLVAFYTLELQFSTTSDWSTLVILNPERILALRTLSTQGEADYASASAEYLALGQPLSAANAGKSVGMTVQLALDANGLDEPLEFFLKKGDLKASTVTVSIPDGDENQVLKEVNHSGVTSSGENPLPFSVDLAELQMQAPQTAQVKTPGLPKLVWAFFYMWYAQSDWSSPWLKDWPSVKYASSAPVVIAQQVDQAQSAGIDGFISSWWGPGSDTDNSLRTLLTIADEKNFKVSLYFETLAGPDGGALREEEIYIWLAYAIRTYREYPAYYQVDGKPLIVLWASAVVEQAAWERIFNKLRVEGLEAVYLGMGYDPGLLSTFDGLHDYGVFLYSDLAQTDLSMARAVRNYSLLEPEARPKIWAATVQPGYDDTLQPTREGLVQERENGDYYRITWEAAIASAPDWIFITSWNEWYEHTHIEPGVTCGDQYLLITREYADQWKGK